MDQSPDYKELYQQSKKERARERAEAERERAEIETERDLLRNDSQPMTFIDFIENSQVYISELLQIGTNIVRSTGGSLTSPKGRLCPTYLRPWEGFHQRQTEIYETVFQLLESLPNPRLFSSRSAIRELGRRLCRRPYGNEEALRGYQHFGVEDLAREIIDVLRSCSEIFPLGEGIEFENHANVLNDDETNSAKDRGRKRSIPDQFCVFRKDEVRSLLFTIEYKDGRKLSDRYLRAGLRRMEFWKEVVQRVTIPLEDDKRLSYHAELLTGSGIVHAYDDMMNSGSAFGCLTTGSCQVFLHVPEDQPDTLEYYLAEPNRDVEAMREQGDDEWMYTPVTAVGRLLTLCLMSTQSPNRSQRWRSEVIPNLHKWEVDFEDILNQLSDDELHSSPLGSEYLPSSPLAPSNRKLRKRIGCRPEENQVSCPDDSDSEDSPQHHESTARKRALTFSSSPPQRQHRSGQKYKRTNQSTQESMDFCTQHCLLSLKNRGLLDENCPNVDRHRKACNKYHQICLSRFLYLLKQQLDNDLDHYCAPCGQSGTHAVPFKITLMPYGYTILGKGTTDSLWPAVRREEDIYQVLGSPTFSFYLGVAVSLIYSAATSNGGVSISEQKRRFDI
ncbi:hypothetical protein UA08_09503 [Talaromyces atroroseus]|uniref:Uncharacterized protein n=1 Tax=Talaromyces atroroseus TaxID=1441469 RepID=A0A1Q5Q697_TALAT|nr:hypothetical protein UA08_09503 [Talaromyces atroroseus]OKL55232.1 hypothetical protein UA08_09503 [Talaromyces atroroseus]